VSGDAPAVEVSELVKRYPRARQNAVDGVSFTVTAAELIGLLGPNGAGKTTTVGVLTTRVRPTAGRGWIGGVDVVADPVGARRQLAVVPQRSNLDRSISIRDNLIFHAAYHGVPARERERRADELLAQFGLLERARDKPDFFSGGQSQRVMIARALMHEPRVLFLDEPTTGLDPRSRRTMWQIIRELVTDGVTIFLTTQYLDEADQLADYVAVLDHGRVVAEGTPAELKRRIPGGHIQLHFAEPDSLRAAVSMIPNATPDDDQLILQVPGDGSITSLRRVLDELDGARITVEHLSIHTPDLDDVFFAVTGHAAIEPPTRQEEEALQS
jgi:ABC-2 type transport system ATP-binding protein